MERMFRLLEADEIECRVSTVNEKGCSLLLYKDARCDMNILDETVGPMNWQKKYSRDNANCEVGIKDPMTEQWVWKEDTGTESFTEKEKGLASDSFKRACFNWGIGRELYTAPFIWIKVPDVKIVPKAKGSGYTTFDKFDVKSIGYDAKGRINHLIIANGRKQVFKMGETKVTAQTDEQAQEEHYDEVRDGTIGETRAKALEKHLGEHGIFVDTVYKLYKVKSLKDLTEAQHANIIQFTDKIKESQDGNQSKTA